MKPNKIDTKYEAFINQYLINGQNATEAYMTVFQQFNVETAKANGSRLLTKANVKALLQVKQEEIRRKYDVKKEDLIKVLKDLLEQTIADNDRPNLLKTVTELNKMIGSYAPVESNVNLKGEAAIKQINIVTKGKING